MEEVIHSTESSSGQMSKSDAVAPVSTSASEPAKKSKTGCIIAGAIGCFGLLIMAGLTVIVVYFFIVKETNTIEGDQEYFTDERTGDWDSNSNHNYNGELYNINSESVTVTDADLSDLYTKADVDENGELIAEDGTSLGFAADSIDSDLFAYQIGAYSSQHFTDTKWPGLQITLDYPKVAAMHDAEDSGSLWVGAVLDNEYFIQIGMMSSTEADADGNMRWNYFWQMWDDQDQYKYGLQEPMDTYDWDKNASNTFTMTCQNPDKGEWEFWVNDEIVGKVSTGKCDMDIYNSQVFWELTTPKTNKSELPEFGPFTLHQTEYWDGYDWQPIQSADLSYGYGRIVDGTDSDQASVCPPYGAQPASQYAFQVGSTIACAENGSVLWQ